MIRRISRLRVRKRQKDSGMATPENQEHPNHAEERRYVWRNLDAYLTGDLDAGDRRRIDDFLCECPHTNRYVQTEKQFAEAVKRCVEEPSVDCPEDLRVKVLTALDQCELDDEPAGAAPVDNIVRFPWMGAVFMAAASIMLMAALVLFFDRDDSGSMPDLPQTLSPMVARVSLEAPDVENCRYAEAHEVYEQHFADGPELPHQFGEHRLAVCDYVCEKVDGDRIMCTVYDAPDGERFGLMVFRCACIDRIATKNMEALEIMIDDKLVLLWREGEYFRALVGKDAKSLHRHMDQLRGLT